MSPVALKLAVVGLFALLLISAFGVWQVQDWPYGKRLADRPDCIRIN